MQQILKAVFRTEMNQAINLYYNNNLDSAFYHLERAHIIAQPFTIPHTRSHWWMLKVNVRQRNFIAVFGQAIRMIASVLFSKFWVP